jgi:glycosyltransferase involved in cell wall biosynthesis
MADVVRAAGAEVVAVPGLGRAVRPLDDLRALGALAALVRRARPAIVHTHTAKGGALGRAAAVLAGAPRRVHTFHGHVLEGYFGRAASEAARAAERFLAAATDAVVCLSPRQRRDLVGRFRVVPRSRAFVIPPGLDLEPYRDVSALRGRLRAELAIPPGAPLLGAIGRLVPVKGPDLLLDAFAEIARARPDARLVVAGSRG